MGLTRIYLEIRDRSIRGVVLAWGKNDLVAAYDLPFSHDEFGYRSAMDALPTENVIMPVARNDGTPCNPLDAAAAVRALSGRLRFLMGLAHGAS